MSTDIQSNPNANQLPEATRGLARQATETAKEVYQSAAQKAEDTIATSKEYVLRNPVPVLLGAIAFGAAIGYLVLSARRKPTFGERCVEEPLGSVRDAILTALAPVAQRIHDGYDSARDGVEKALNRPYRSTADAVSGQISRVGNNLKFW